MLHKTRLLIVATGALFALPAWASDVPAMSPVTANISIVNDYVFRGISRTNFQPAVQGGVDLAADNGIYIGAWGSNISWLADRGVATASSLELDAYAGIKNTFWSDYSYDIGMVRYHFPGTYNAGQLNADTNEIHAALSYGWVALKYSYSIGNTFGVAGSAGSHYADLGLRIPFSDAVTMGVHVGQQTYAGAAVAVMSQSGMDPSYRDWQLSLAWKVAGWELGAAYSGTNSPTVGYYTNVRGENLARKQAVLSVRRTF